MTESFGAGILDVYLIRTDTLGDTLWTRTYGDTLYETGLSVFQTQDGGFIIGGNTNSFGAGLDDLYLIKTDSSGDTLWTRTFGGIWWDYGYSVQQTVPDGGYIIAGHSRSFGAGNGDIYLVKTDSSGNTLWTRTYGGTGVDYGFSAQQTLDGGYVITGWTNSFGSGEYDVYLIKTDSLGDTMWTRSYGGNLSDYGNSVQQTSDGGYIVVGYTDSFGAGMDDIYLIKTDSSGDTLWTKTYGETEADYGNSVRQTSDGGYILLSDSWKPGSSYNFLLIKTDSIGDTLWTRTYGGNSFELGFSVQQTTDGGYILSGYTESYGNGFGDFYLVKVNSSGDTLWTRTYGGTSTEYNYFVQQTSDGGYIISGSTASFGAGSYDLYLVKTDSSGVTLWTQTYGGSNSDYGSTVWQTSDGGYTLTGLTNSYGSGGEDVYLLRTDSLGYTLWTRTFGGSLDDAGVSLQQTLDGGYIVAGYSYSSGAGLQDVYLIKTDGNGMVVGVEERTSDSRFQISNFRLFQNRPNPFNGSTVIRYIIPVGARRAVPVRLAIYDINGRLVETLVDKVQDPGVYQIPWEGKNQASGVYFYRLTARIGQDAMPAGRQESSPYMDSRKLILLR